MDLKVIARQIMLERGFIPDFPPQALEQLSDIKKHTQPLTFEKGVRDLRHLPWSSIDNDDSLDIDQIEVAEPLTNGMVKIMIAIADVDALVPKNSPIDIYASEETTTVYAGIRTFPMLPNELSNDKTSLAENMNRPSIVIEFTVKSDGSLSSSDIYRAIVRNHAQLTYNSVGKWLESSSLAPIKISESKELQEQLKLQDKIAQILKNKRHEHGGLYLESIQIHPIFSGTKIADIANQEKNRATDLIEDFMITANEVVGKKLEKLSILKRVVKTPKRWDRIVQLAANYKTKLPSEPSSKELNEFLISRKTIDPDHFADLSLAIIKLIGPGEYIMERGSDNKQGHFGLAVQDYTHSTAPNRRFADIVTQRIIKAMLNGDKNPYSDEELVTIANNCTLKENLANKVERDMSKRIAAMVMSHRIGEIFNAVVTGVTTHGTFVRILHPHVEGLLAQGETGLDVGDILKVKLIYTDVNRGYIDFANINR